MCTRGGVGRRVYTWSTCPGTAPRVHSHPWSTPGTVISVVAVPGEHALGSASSYSLGKVPWRQPGPGSCRGRRRILSGREDGAKSKNGKRSDSRRATPPLIKPKTDCCGESSIPDILLFARASNPE